MTIRPFAPRAAFLGRPLRCIAVLSAALAPAGRHAAAASEWRPPKAHEPTLGELVSGLLSGQGGALTAPLALAALLLALLVGLQVLGSRS